VVVVTAEPTATTDAPPTTGAAPTPDTPPTPGAGAAGGVTRYRCAACGNLTRFDVVTTRRTRAFHHFSVGGELTIEDVEVLDEAVEAVTCRWCGNGGAVEVIESGASDPS